PLGGKCNTTATAASSPAGSPETKCCKLSTPPAEAPIAIRLLAVMGRPLSTGRAYTFASASTRSSAVPIASARPWVRARLRGEGSPTCPTSGRAARASARVASYAQAGAPVRRGERGRQDRGADNFLAETEPVAFCT